MRWGFTSLKSSVQCVPSTSEFTGQARVSFAAHLGCLVLGQCLLFRIWKFCCLYWYFAFLASMDVLVSEPPLRPQILLYRSFWSQKIQHPSTPLSANNTVTFSINLKLPVSPDQLTKKPFCSDAGVMMVTISIYLLHCMLWHNSRFCPSTNSSQWQSSWNAVELNWTFICQWKPLAPYQTGGHLCSVYDSG